MTAVTPAGEQLRRRLLEAAAAQCDAQAEGPEGAQERLPAEFVDFLQEQGATPQEVVYKAGLYRRLWPGVALTPASWSPTLWRTLCAYGRQNGTHRKAAETNERKTAARPLADEELRAHEARARRRRWYDGLTSDRRQVALNRALEAEALAGHACNVRALRQWHPTDCQQTLYLIWYHAHGHG